MTEVEKIEAQISILNEQRDKYKKMYADLRRERGQDAAYTTKQTIVNEVYFEIIYDLTNEIKNLKEDKNFAHLKMAYDIVNKKIDGRNNTRETRHEVIQLLLPLLPFEAIVISDEANNPPGIIDRNILMARVKYRRNFEQRYVDLTFGDVEVLWENIEHKL